MKKTKLFLVCLIAMLIMATSSIVAFAAEGDLTIEAGSPFSATTDAPSAGKTGVTGGAQGPWDINMNAVGSSSRLYYGASGKPNDIDIRNFSMEFSIDQIATGGSFKIAFLSSHNEFPQDDYATGLSINFEQDGNKGFIVKTFTYPGNTNSSSWNYFLVYDNSNPRVEESVGKDIVLTITEEGKNKMLIDMRFKTATATMVPYRTIVDMPANFDFTRAVLFFTNSSAEDATKNVKLNISKIEGIRDPSAGDIMDYVIDSSAPFSSQTSNGVSHELSKVQTLTTGSYKITQNAKTASNSRLFYGENTTPYGVSLKDFEMDIAFNTFNNINGANGKFTLAFLSTNNDFPQDNYGKGLSISFIQGTNAFTVETKTHNATTETLLNSAALKYNRTTNASHLDKTIKLSIKEKAGDSDKFVISIAFNIDSGTTSENTVKYSYEIAKTTISNTTLDLANACLFFAPMTNITGDIVYTISNIKDSNTAAYLGGTVRTAATTKIDAYKTAIAAFKSYDEYDKYVFDRAALNPLRSYDKLALMAWEDKAYSDMLSRFILLSPEKIESQSNYTSTIRNNQDGSYAEVLSDGKEKLVLKNKFSVDGSSLGLKKTVDISDFEMEFSFDNICYDKRVTFLFAQSQDAYNFNGEVIPGLSIVTMLRDGNLTLLVSNSAAVADIEGVNTNEWHILLDSDNQELKLAVDEGDEVKLALKADVDGNISFSVSAGAKSIGASVPKTFFTANELDTENMYFKICAGDQAFASGDDLFTVITVNSINDKSNVAAMAAAQKFITDSAEVITLAGAVALLESGISLNSIYMQEKQLYADFGAAIVNMRAYVNTEMLKLANEFATATQSISDVNASALTDAKLSAVMLKQSGFYNVSEYLDYLSTTQVNAILDIIRPADYAVTRAQVYIKVNAYVSAVQTAEKANIPAAKDLRKKITTADLALLSDSDRAAINTMLVDADTELTEKENAPDEGCNGCGSNAVISGFSIAAILICFAAAVFVALRKKA